MTVYLDDLMDPELLEEELEADRVSRKLSPDGSMEMYTYTKKVQWQNEWNEVTTQARGLVVDARTGEVLARPFDKFFNLGQDGAPDWGPDAPVAAYDKLDGSLVILLPDGTLATKGSFTSEQAKVATEIYQEHYAGTWEPDEGSTYLFEVIYPEGRIVLDYGGQRDLVLLGARDIDTGDVFDPWILGDYQWPGPKAERLGANLVERLDEVLAKPQRKNAEGMVLYGIHDQKMAKLKYDDYKALHAIVTNTSAITLWEAMAAWDMTDAGTERSMVANSLGLDPKRVEAVWALGPSWEEGLTAEMPDEFHDWAENVLDTLEAKFRRVAAGVKAYGQGAVLAADGDPNDTQAMYEQLKPLEQEIRDELNLPMGAVLTYSINAARGHAERGMANGKVRGNIWKAVRPKGNILPEAKKTMAAGVN